MNFIPQNVDKINFKKLSLSPFGESISIDPFEFKTLSDFQLEKAEMVLAGHYKLPFRAIEYFHLNPSTMIERAKQILVNDMM